jgi:ribulose-5-phosphate 4-epimerase/fuculose-1-phosphate aldolase
MSTKAIKDISEKLSQAGKELYTKGLVKGTSGNINSLAELKEKFKTQNTVK